MAIVGIGAGGATAMVVQSSAAVSAPTINAAALIGEGRIAFVSQGDLYVANADHQDAVRVTFGVQQAGDPQFSPGGEWLVYSTGARSTTFLARGDGTKSVRLPGSASWLPNGELSVRATGATANSIYTVGADGALHRSSTTDAQVTKTDGQNVYVFNSSTLNVSATRSPAQGIVRVATSTTPTGPRTVWFQAKQEFTPGGGLGGTFVGAVTVLPAHAGLVMAISGYCCDYADGMPLYLVRTPGGIPEPIGSTLDWSSPPSLGPDDEVAFAAGGGREAWNGKYVALCGEQSATCRRLTDPKTTLSLAPSWSPDRTTLAFVEAPPRQSDFAESQVEAWYRSRDLYLMSAGSQTPREVAGTRGAAAPEWSGGSKSLLFVANDALYLVRQAGSTPVKVAGPLFSPGTWPSYYGQVNWASQFAWSAAATVPN